MEKLNTNEVLIPYKQTLHNIIPYLLPTLSRDELDRAIDYSINKRFKNSPCGIYNNYKETKINTNLLKLTEFLISKKPIMTSYGCLFTRHGDVPNPLSSLIEEFAANRNKFKKEMLQYVKGSEEYEHFNLLQLVAKVDTNAIYGCLGAQSSIFYNIFVAQSITREGRCMISSAIMFFESIMANNVKFGSLNEIVVFIDNVTKERVERVYRDRDILDRNISPEELFTKLIMTCGYNWLPSMEDCEAVWQIVNRLDQEDINRIYYKNNIFQFVSNKRVSGLIIKMLQKLESPFLDPNKPPKVIEEDLYEFTSLIREFVYYKYQYIDKLERVATLVRECSILTDTDSTMITVEPWYQYIRNMTIGVDMKLKTLELDGADILEAKDLNSVEGKEVKYDYDFYRDELVERKRLVEPCKLIPQDGLRYSIINILAYCLGKLVNEYMQRLSEITNSDGKYSPCLLTMKNEFLFRRILLTPVKKNYVTKQEIQEGHAVPDDIDKALHIAGLQLVKSGTAESTRKELSRILYEDVVNSNEVDQLAILNDLAVMEKKIFLAIQNGSTDYFKPQRIKGISSYDMPMRIQGIKGAVVYNDLKNDSEPAINLENNNAVLIIKTKITDKIADNSILAKEDPGKYNRMKQLLADEEYFKGEITSIAIPHDLPIPKWLFEFIDYETIIIDNIGAFPSDSVGLPTMNTNSAYSGIIEL